MYSFDTIYFVGDLHGTFNYVSRIIERLIPSNSLLIGVGDIGIGFEHPAIESRILGDWENLLSEKKCHLFLIRGNHDDPKYWSTNRITGFPHINFVADYTRLKINDEIFLFVGGALSIDRTARIIGIDYWPGEKFVYQPQTEPCDVLVTHTAPREASPQLFNQICFDYFKRDDTLKEECIQERELVSKLVGEVKPKLNVYGHFHKSDDEVFNGTRFKLLNIGELWEYVKDS